MILGVPNQLTAKTAWRLLHFFRHAGGLTFEEIRLGHRLDGGIYPALLRAISRSCPTALCIRAHTITGDIDRRSADTGVAFHFFNFSLEAMRGPVGRSCFPSPERSAT